MKDSNNSDHREQITSRQFYHESSILSVEIDDIETEQKIDELTIDELEELSSGHKALLTIENDELPMLDAAEKLVVAVDDEVNRSQKGPVNSCLVCGEDIRHHRKTCQLCSSRPSVNLTGRPGQNKFTKKSIFGIASIVTVFIMLLFYANQLVSNSGEGEPTPQSVPPSGNVLFPDSNKLVQAGQATLQEAINSAGDGDVIEITNNYNYGPLDFKGKNLVFILRGDNSSEPNSQIAVSGAIITIYNAKEIIPLLKGYKLVDGKDHSYQELRYQAITNYYDYPGFPGTYLELDVQDNDLVIRGRATEAGRKLVIVINSGAFRGEYYTVSGNDYLFEAKITLSKITEGVRIEEVRLDVYQDDGTGRTYSQFYANLIVNLAFSGQGLESASFVQTLAYDGNASAWNSYRDPRGYLNADSSIQSNDPKIIRLAKDLVNSDMPDFEKLVVIHDWVTKNIAYDVSYSSAGKRSPQDAVSVLERRIAVCSGYSNLMAALLRSVNISARYVSGNALGSHDPGRGWEEEGLYDHPVGHAWNEAYIDGEWITVDATWNAGYTDSATGKFVSDQSYNYFAPSLELFSRSHFIP